ncbi:MAG TPA: HAD family hydrolase [Spirochaetota bacterium]|nr:HAD family hydrolase [Spirochaetota bacterium]
MNIALFDFDGTITKKDTLFDFIIFAVGYKTFIIKLISLVPLLILYTLKIIPNWYAKEKLLAAYFKGWELKNFDTIAHKYAQERISSITKEEAIKAIEKHKVNGDLIVVVTASCQNWVKPWCDEHKIDCVATRLEIKNGKLTGRFDGKNCYGKEKVNRIKEKYNLSNYKKIYAYGNSKGDKEMLDLAQVRVYKWVTL